MTRYWIDEKNGNDANGGLTPETAFKTRMRALDVVDEGLPIDVLVTLNEGQELFETDNPTPPNPYKYPRPITDEMLQAVLGVKIVKLSGWVTLIGVIVPDPDVVAIGIKNQRTLAAHLL